MNFFIILRKLIAIIIIFHDFLTFYKDQGAHVAADGPDCFVGGWGTLSSGGSSPNVPYSVNVDILTDQYCQAKGSSNNLRLKSHFQIHN